MRTGQPLGLDELMIVNPGLPGVAAVFLSDDGRLYQVVGLRQAELSPVAGHYFLGEDGALYQRQGLGLVELAGGLDARDLGCYWVALDSALYEIVDETY